MRNSRLKRAVNIFVSLGPTFMRSLLRSNLMLYFAFLGLISLVTAWEWLRGSAAPDFVEQSEGEIVLYIGDVGPGSKSTRNVPIKNKTSSPLTIQSVSRSCSCLAVGLDYDSIQPGGTATLKVAFLAPERQGGFRHELQVSFVGDQDPIRIRLLGTVSAWIKANVSVVEFGDTYPGDISRQRLQLKVHEPWPEDQRRINLRMPYTRIESATTDDEGKSVMYTIAFHPPAGSQSKECDGELVIDWVGHTDRGFKLPCKGKVASEWVSDPARVVLGRVSAKEPPTFTVQIRNQRHPEAAWRRRYKVIAGPSGLLDASSTWGNSSWQVTASVRKEGLLHPGVKSAALCVTAPDGMVMFRVPVYWEAEP
jgi:hypothetical protein